MTSEIVNSLQKSILLLYCASQLPSDSAQGSVLPPQSRAFRQPLQPESAHALHPKQPLQIPDQFYDWLSLIGRLLPAASCAYRSTSTCATS